MSNSKLSTMNKCQDYSRILNQTKTNDKKIESKKMTAMFTRTFLMFNGTCRNEMRINARSRIKRKGNKLHRC